MSARPHSPCSGRTSVLRTTKNDGGSFQARKERESEGAANARQGFDCFQIDEALDPRGDRRRGPHVHSISCPSEGRSFRRHSSKSSGSHKSKGSSKSEKKQKTVHLKAHTKKDRTVAAHDR